MSLAVKYEEFDKAFCQALAEYHELHKQLDQFRGVDLTDEIIAQANPIIMAIQDKYNELIPAIEWGIVRYSACARLKQDYHQFIDHIKQGGAVVDEIIKHEAQA